MFSALPSDCLDAILSFLPLESMIQLGATSTRCLSDIQPEIQRRRQRFNQTFCYSSTLDRPKAQLYSRGLCEIHLLPTVRDRIDSLFKVLATSHPCYHQVAELREAITRVDVEQPSAEDAKEDTMLLLKRHGDNARPHKLHALILRQVINSDPAHVNLSQTTNGGGEEGVLAVTLERYIGDVLCAFYLMGHSDSCIIEASPGESAWKASLLAELKVENECGLEGEVISPDGVSASAWYRAWVFVHSFLLRVAPFTWQQQTRLGIASPTPTASAMAFVDVAHGSLLRPHRPFSGGSQILFLRLLTSISNFAPLRVTFKNFGHLHQYRGRDTIESLTFYPATVLGMAICFEQLEPQEYYGRGPLSNFQPFLRQWIRGQDAVIQCLFQLHEQSRRARPMTVLPPLVSLRGAAVPR